MSSDLNEYLLEELAAPQKNAMVGGPFGSNLVSKDYQNAGVPVIRGQNMGMRWVSGKFAFVSESKAAKLSANTARPGDLVFTQRGTLGQVSIVPAGPYEEYIVSQSQMKITVNPDLADVGFLYYYFSALEQVDYVKTNAIQTGVPHTNLGILRKTPVLLPSLSSQKVIATVLSGLDDKIELNYRINQTLEQMAQTLFKSWFVDFEPVKAKIAARKRWQALQPENECASPVCYAAEFDEMPAVGDLETYMNRAAMQAISGKTAAQLDALRADDPERYQELYETAALFPSAMQDSELGEIPEGWECSTIGAEVEIKGGGTPPTKNKEYWEGGDINWTSPKDLSGAQSKVMISTERKITEAGLAKISSGLLPINTVLMSSRAPVGYLALTKIPVAINQGYIAMICKKRLQPEFVLQWAESVMDDIKQLASGSTFAEISKKSFRSIPIVVPDGSVAKIFCDMVRAKYLSIELNLKNSNDLSEMRDALLPKLLSGELEI
ncbi:restriction endonuclease subunit S [Larsenimonas rhizosphaerae]|uniref:Restriction endonuclease subunit S n=1 Tax=Larsenimonas rhizosphaerae TaxID=2944682 RepID=A0AA41ZQ96_9GAMM|nr:restriction endonuclease subunit S [Larsenimonas rhizosphaerae]MCX2525330.1 restriction endonuclease subunit S [Larsenimonas rhizosphaerae]